MAIDLINMVPGTTSESVNLPHSSYTTQSANWALCEDLKGGTERMQARGEVYLPKEEKESQKNYLRKLNRTYLYEAYKDCIDLIKSKPLGQPVDYKSDFLPEKIRDLPTKLDAAKTTIDNLVSSLLEDVATYGRAHIYVDMPAIPDDLSEAEEREQGIVPIVKRLSPRQIFNWSFTTINSEQVLDRIHIREVVEEESVDSFITTEVEQIRVVSRDVIQIWRKVSNDNNKWVLKEVSVNELGKVPLSSATIAEQPNVFESVPPLKKLARLNLVHYQSTAEQRNILRVSRFAILVAKGMNDDDKDAGIDVGPNTVITVDEGGELKFVEHTGKGLEAGRQDLEDLEVKMQRLSLHPFASNRGNETATARIIDNSNGNTILEHWIRALEITLRQAFDLAAEWLSLEELDEEFKFDIYDDFAKPFAVVSADTIINMMRENLLTLETGLRVLMDNGHLPQDLDINAEAENIRKLLIDFGL